MSDLERVMMVEAIEYDDHGRQISTVIQTARNLNAHGLARMIGFHPDFAGPPMTMHLQLVRSQAAIRRQGFHNAILRDPNNNIVDYGSFKRKPQETPADWGCQNLMLEISRREWASEVWSSDELEKANRSGNWGSWQKAWRDFDEQVRALIKNPYNILTEPPFRIRIAVKNDDDMVHVRLLPKI